MKATPRIHVVRQEVCITVEGAVTASDLQEVVTRLLHDDLLHFRKLLDLRGATSELNAEGLSMVAVRIKTLTRTRTSGPCAVLVSSELLHRQMNMLQQLLEGICHLQPFRNPEEAEAWLAGRPLGAFSDVYAPKEVC